MDIRQLAVYYLRDTGMILEELADDLDIDVGELTRYMHQDGIQSEDLDDLISQYLEDKKQERDRMFMKGLNLDQDN